MTPEEWRALVGARIEQRRAELNNMSVRAAAKRAHISEGLWRTIESGQRQAAKGVFFPVNPKPDTRRRVCRVLGWSADSIDRLLAGDEPQLADYGDGSLWGRSPGDNYDDVDAPPEPVVLARLDRLERMVSDVLDVVGQRDAKFGALSDGIAANHSLLEDMVPILRELQGAPLKPPSSSPKRPSGRKHIGDRLGSRSAGEHTPPRGVRR